MLNVLSIDVEEHYQAHAFENVIDRTDWDRQPSRVVANTERILRLLAKHQVRATFFVLGWVADRHPGLVRQIAQAGHEIGTHGYWHQLIYRQNQTEFAADVRHSIEAIQRVLPSWKPLGYRAPAFSIVQDSLWALDVLSALGFRYDSSIFPLLAHDRYGISTASRFGSRLPNGMWEIPISTVRVAGRNWPVAGGGYFRLFPLWLTRSAIRHINAEGQPAVIYLHPWEFDPDQPRVVNAPLTSRFRHYVNLDRTELRLESLLCEFRFGSVVDVFASKLGS
ncbi:XrtA system polysaccharide deacetylase [Microvirga vignae]|uniref:XrtA system polysaccharide deacetylase n=1 Tax=Microvirga vignae TaxID=1225564 RepID=UPI000A00FF15